MASAAPPLDPSAAADSVAVTGGEDIRLDFPGLLANAVGQDGDALLPLVVMARRSALAVTALTSVPALVVGSAAALLLA